MNYNQLKELTPQVVSEKGKILDDTSGWTEISGIFRAQGGEKYFRIGLFFSKEKYDLKIIDENPSAQGKYWIAYFFDDVSLYELPYPDLGPDTVLCPGGTVTLDPHLSSPFLSWSDGSRGQTLTVSRPGWYWAALDSGEYHVRDSIYISEPPAWSLGPDRGLCLGDSFLIRLPDNGTTYTWGHGGTEREHWINAPGAYVAEASHKGCISRDTLIVWKETSLAGVQVLPDTTVCQGGTLSIHLPDSLHLQAVWPDGSRSQQWTVPRPGNYSMDVINSCGRYSQSFTVRPIDCSCPVYIPSVYSPNGDGVNDSFRVSVPCIPSEYSLQIYNRWGERVFGATSPQQRWDGTLRGAACPEGVYYYHLQYRPPVGPPESRKGTVTVIK